MKASIEKIIFDNGVDSSEQRVLVCLFLDKPNSPPCVRFEIGQDEINFNFFQNTIQRKQIPALIEALDLARSMK